MLQRTLSLTRGERPQSGLIRRLSGKSRPPTKEFNLGGAPPERRMSMDGPFPPAGAGDSYFPPTAEPRPGPFLRRPTNLSQKAGKRASKRGDDGAGAFVNLEGGLAVTLNLELNPKDPSGITTPYKLLIPALWFEGTEYDPPAAPVTKGWRKWLGVRRNASSKPSVDDDDDDDEAEAEYSDEGEHDTPDQAQAPRQESPQAATHAHAVVHPVPHPRPVVTRPAPTPAPQSLDDEYDDEDDSEFSFEPEPEPAPPMKRSTSIKKWFGRS